ncbi:MAG: hypothetical protein ABJC07_07745 [Acidobacteriota bacterium]
MVFLPAPGGSNKDAYAGVTGFSVPRAAAAAGVVSRAGETRFESSDSGSGLVVLAGQSPAARYRSR